MTDPDDHTADRDARPDQSRPDGVPAGGEGAPDAAPDAVGRGAGAGADDQAADTDETPADETASDAGETPADGEAAPADAVEIRAAAAEGSPADEHADEPDIAPDGPTSGGDDDARTTGSLVRRFAKAVFTPKLTAANLVITLLVGLLGFALIVQVRSNASESTLANDRPDDLVRILSDLDARKDRLSTEISSLQSTVQQLNSGAQGRQAALAAAAKRADELGILGGTLPATGPGLVVNLVPAANQQIPANTVLDTVEELRGAGAEAMQIGGGGTSPVRVVASTYFTESDGGVNVDGTTLVGTLSITVIGDPQTIQAALSIPGGVVDTVHNDGGTVQLDTPGTVNVTALRTPEALRYAHPVS